MKTRPDSSRQSCDHNNSLILSAALIIALMIAVASISLGGMDSIRVRAETIASNQNTKLELVVKMHSAARERTVILQRMILLDDPFTRDEEYMRFNRQGAEFANARMAYLKSELSNEEKLLLDKQGSLSREAVRLQNNVVDLVAADEIQQARNLLIDETVPLQDRVLETLTELHETNNKISRDLVDEATRAYHGARLWLLFSTTIAISIVVILGILIHRRSSQLNRERESNISEINRANKAKSAFLANMSHEIRTPLTAIIGFAEASLDSNQTVKERLSALRTIVRSGKHLLQVINDILDLSKIEADKLEIEKIEVPLFQLMSEIESVARMQVADKSFTFNINYEFPVADTIITDPLRLKQVLFNLLGNAFKFTKSGHVNVNISCDTQNDMMLFSVIDSGVGISQQQLDSIFKAFSQEDVSTSRKFGGTGLGLSISKLLVEKLGGTISVQSTKGVGSNFTVSIRTENLANAKFVNSFDEIPIISTEDHTDILPSEKSQLAGHILLAEDNLDNQTLIAMHLEKMGAIVQIVENGKLAVQEALDNQYDLIFMDMQMPVIDGVEAVKLLRSKNYEGPIVALTANAMKEDKNKCLNAGCDGFITKPINKEKLYEVTARYLKAVKVASSEDTQPIYSTLLDEGESYIGLINQFIGNLPGRVDELIRTYNNNELSEVRKIVHDLKGLGGGYGFNQLSEIASKLMFLLEDNNTKIIPSVLIELEDICKRIYKGAEQQMPTPQKSIAS